MCRASIRTCSRYSLCHPPAGAQKLICITHPPGAISIPFSELVDPTTKALKTAAELQTLFLEKGVDTSSKTEKILMCGTGVTAVVVDAALELAGIEGKRRVYDGSWT